MNIGIPVLVGVLVIGSSGACGLRGPQEQLISRGQGERQPVYPAGWGFFSGVVRTPDGAPLAEVHLTPKGRKSELALMNLPDGTFRIAVPHGHQVLVLSKRGYVTERIEANIESSKDHVVAVTMRPV